jgi:hypothetical protein
MIATGSESRTSTRWDGDNLVFFQGLCYTTTPDGTRHYNERIETWSLAADGSLTVAITERSSDVDPRTREAKYVRR